MKLLSVLFLLPFLCLAQHRSTISGRVVGTDGQPLAMAHVGLSGGSGWEDVHLDTEDKIFSSVLVNQDGSFSISTDSLGALRLWCMGVGSKLFTVPIILERPTKVELTVKLEPFHFTPSADGIEINYDFDEVSRGKRAILKETSAQMYEADIPTVKKELKYRINSIVNHPVGISVPYSTHDGYEYYMDGMYTTIVHPQNEKVTISLDYSKAAKDKESPTYAFADSQSVQARFVSYYFRSLLEKERYDKALYDHMAAGKKYGEFMFDWVPFEAQMTRDLEREQNQIIADELVIEYLEMAVFSKDRIFSNKLGIVEKYDSPVGNSKVHKALNGISAQSPVWVYHKAIALQAAKYHPLQNAYVEKIIQTHPSRSYRGYLTFRKFSYIENETNNIERERLFSQLVNEFADTPAGNWVKRSMTLREQLTIGSPLPAFHFKDLENAANTFTNDDFKGKYFLLEFWATWCGPCNDEIPYLEKAYEKYHPLGLEILSVSNERSTVIKFFRSTKHAMPWHHSVVDEEEQGNVQQRFSVCDPKAILVGPDGVVLEIYNGFSPDINFDTLLAKYLVKK